MNIYRCRICGDVIITKTLGSHCYFCGAPDKYIVPTTEWHDENKDLILTDISKENLTKALDLELHANVFYQCVAGIEKDIEIQSIFKGFAKVELEHASLISKILKISKEDFQKYHDKCNENSTEMLKEAQTREDNAIKEYVKGLNEATEQRVKDVFTSLIVAERGHLVILEKKLN